MVCVTGTNAVGLPASFEGQRPHTQTELCTDANVASAVLMQAACAHETAWLCQWHQFAT